MSHDRERALGQYVTFKKRIYNSGIKAQSLLNTLHEEIDTLLNGKDFSSIDFGLIETLVKELKQIQSEFNEIADKMKQLKDTYNFSE